MVKDTLLARFSGRDEVPVKQVDQVLAGVCELELDLFALASDEHEFAGHRTAAGGLLFLDALDSAPAGTECGRDVLVSDGEEVALFRCQTRVRVRDD